VIPHAYIPTALYSTHNSAACVKRVHDLCVVWAFELQNFAAVDGGDGVPGHCVFEYWFAVPANRMGHSVYTSAELKTMQEVITFAVFVVFSVFFLKEAITLKHIFGFSLIALGAAVVFRA
jgi:Putative member of DMT superfamily (DUF486)